MASDRRIRPGLGALSRAGIAVAALCLAASTCAVSAAASAVSWWQPLALHGTDLIAVHAQGALVVVRTSAGMTLRSQDGGATFARVAGDPALIAARSVRSGRDTWAIDAGGRVLHAVGGARLALDPGSPRLGEGADLIAAPASAPGVVLAAATDGTVWRRDPSLGWARALLLLPAGGLGGVPRVTALAAFTRPVTSTVYLGTAGYGVLLSADGGDDWVRADPGLPADVYGLSADSTTRSLYAATSRGLYVHHLQAFPGPAAYRDSALVLRWLGYGAVVLVVVLLAGALLLAWARAQPARG